MKNFKKTWTPPNPAKVEGLPKDYVARWTKNTTAKIAEWEDQGYQVLDTNSEIAKNVKAGYGKRTGSTFMMGNCVLMIARKEVKELRDAHYKKLNEAMLNAPKKRVEGAIKSTGTKVDNESEIKTERELVKRKKD